MKIHYLRIDGFRSLKHIEWKPGDLNVIIGKNASGKSNLLRLLKLISASAKGKLRDTIFAEGGMNELVWDGEDSNIGFSLDTSSKDEQVPALSNALLINRLNKSAGYVIATESIYSADEKPSAKSLRKVVERGAQDVLLFENNSLSQQIKIEKEWESETALSQMTAFFPNADKILPFKNYLTNWTIYENIDTSYDAAIRRPVAVNDEQIVASDGHNLTNVLHTLRAKDRDFKSEIDLGMRAAFDDYEDIVFLPSGHNIELAIQWKSLQQPRKASDLSDGTLRFLFLMAVLAASEPSPLIAIDEPEIGLHPRMMPIVAEFAIDAARRSQIIFTTHSEAFLDAFRDKRPTTTVIGMENGETTLKVVDDEELAYWIKNFTLGDIFRSGTLEHIA